MVTVARGVFAPGHLGELTGIVPFEMVDAVLAEAGGMQQRVRMLPSRVVVYLLLAAGLFAELGYLGVWGKWGAPRFPDSSLLAYFMRRAVGSGTRRRPR